jgi:hypothetical protein
MMLELRVFPRNREHFSRLIDFMRGVLHVCESLGIEPVASGSLVVLLYTQDETMEVKDVDLSCSEGDFDRLAAGLLARGISASATDWHVLQARRDDLKIEFDSREHWMHGLSEEHAPANVHGLHLTVVSREALIELYERGLAATSEDRDETTAAKRRSIHDRLNRLTSAP